MASIDEQILRAAKEIVVKFIETGRVSPMAFPEAFEKIYQAVDDTVKTALTDSAEAQSEPSEPRDPPRKKKKR